MKNPNYILLAVLVILSAAVSCKKDNPKGKYGVDGVTPLPEAVDLGTVVNGKNIKWASFNLGASKEYEYGDYYAWGETSAKTDYSWATYAYATYDYATGYYNKLSKYCPKDKTSLWGVTNKEPDGEVMLLPSDDVAHVKLGGKWRMPTLDEINALLALKAKEDYTWEKWTFATDADGNMIKDARGNVIFGIRITRKSTGATLFLPAADCFDGKTVGEDAGIFGFYWSSSLNPGDPDSAFILYFYSDGSVRDDYDRYYGLSVRPVWEE